MKKFVCTLALAILLTFSGLIRVAFALNLTSLTVEGVTDNGLSLNAPGGIWSTNLADPLTQLGVRQDGIFLNNPVGGIDLGEISIELKPGIYTIDLYGSSPREGFDYYGIYLFFDHIATPPQIAVYNSNGSTGDFSITPAGMTIAGSANGGSFPDVAPGSAIYYAPDGSSVELIAFTVNLSSTNPDLVSWGNIAPDGFHDVIAHLTLKCNPPNQPPIAICKNVTVTVGSDCQADVSVDDGSYDPDDDPITIIQDPPGPYPLGSTTVTLTVTDSEETSDSCTATVTVVDDIQPEVQCNTPQTIIPPDAPISFTAAATDNCEVSEIEITDYNRFFYNPSGKRVDKTSSCAVQINGDTITILDSGGVGTHITWTIRATDSSGNTTVTNCEVEVVNPGKGKKKK